MKSKSAIAAELHCQPWLVSPLVHREFSAALAKAVVMMEQPKQEPGKPYSVTSDGVAVIPVRGMLWRGWSSALYDPWFGVTSTDIMQQAVEDADRDPNVTAIMLQIDSPGGMVTGVPEAAMTIKAAIKPTLAYNSGLMDSAAYWLASQTNLIYATPSARTGSIGAYIALLDSSVYFEREGLAMEVFKSGADKGMGLPGTKLTDSQRERMQTRIDRIGAEFRGAVATGRDKRIPAEYMEGDDYDAQEAIAGNLIDVVGTPAAAVAALLEMAKQNAAKQEWTR
jgi:signal peptide peptidase SppA